MKFFEKSKPEMNDTRFITKFLLWPLKIKTETRWLERATIKQLYKSLPGYGYPGTYYKTWIDVEWIDD